MSVSVLSRQLVTQRRSIQRAVASWPCAAVELHPAQRLALPEAARDLSPQADLSALASAARLELGFAVPVARPGTQSGGALLQVGRICLLRSSRRNFSLIPTGELFRL